MTYRLSLQLQPPVTYDAHLGWNLSRQAYASDGPESWLGGEMPFQVSNNATFAAQQAGLLLEALEAFETPPEVVSVLELGAGTGAFAWHFIEAFGRLSKAAGKTWPLRYLLSDPVAANLEALAGNSHFWHLIAKGTLRLVHADLLIPGRLTDLQGRILGLPELHLICLNYVFCHLPFRLLKSERHQLVEGLISTYWEPELAASEQLERAAGCLEGLTALPDGSQLEALLPAEDADEGLLDLLQPQAHSERLRFETTERELDGPLVAWLEAQLREWPGRWVMVPDQALLALQEWSEDLCPEGLILISDKGWARPEVYRHVPEPSRHGRHLVWPVHFPILASWFEHQGFSALQTDHPLWPMHTLMAIKGPVPQALGTRFEAELNRRNLNLYAAELVDSAESARDAGDLRKAAMLYLQALEQRPGDGRLRHELVACLIELQAFDQAANELQQPVIDLFTQYDFDFQAGQLHLFQGRYPEAIRAFMSSLERFGPDAAGYYNLGLCQIMMGHALEARVHFEAALGEDPGHELAQTALASWDETFYI